MYVPLFFLSFRNLSIQFKVNKREENLSIFAVSNADLIILAKNPNNLFIAVF